MSSHQSRRAKRGTAEQMLRAVPGVTPGEADALVALFSAAGPSLPGELAGEDAATSAFRSALHLPAPITRRVPPMKRSLAALLTVKTAAAALVVTSMGGVALAATGVPLKHESKAAKAAEQAAVQSPANFHGLCNAVAAGAWDNPGKAAQGTAFQRLVDAAVLAEQDVAAYCAGLPAETEVPAEQAASTEDTADEAKAKGKSAQAHERKSAPHGKSADAPGHAADKPGKAHDQQATHDAEKAAKDVAKDVAKAGRTAEKDAKVAAKS